MKLGLNLKAHQWDDGHLRLARQLGCESVVAWMPLPPGDGVWHVADLRRIKTQANAHGLELAAIENLPPAHWDKILLGEPGRDQQMANVAQTVRNLGIAGIPCLGYYFSVVGVWGHRPKEPNGRGGASLKSFDLSNIPTHEPPNNQNIWINTTLAHRDSRRTIPRVGEDSMWERLTYFLKNLVPVAEESGVKLAAHPEDPPVPELRGIHRCLHNVEALRRLVEIAPSPSNCLEFCQGTVSEIPGHDVIKTIRHFASQRKIAYVHFRNVSATVPKFEGVFIDEGRVDMIAAMKAYHTSGFDGTIVPDHTPELSYDCPWEIGMAYALGYMRACLQAAEK